MNHRLSQMKLTEDLVRLCHRDVEYQAVDEKYDYLTDDDYPPLAAALLAKKPPGPLWIFAYGSLIWKRDFEIAEQAIGVAHGWHRSFCLRMVNFRGTLEQPGLMMALEKGGHCEGVLLKLHGDQEEKTLNTILYREVGSHEQLESARWISVHTATGIVEALAFYAGPDNLDNYISALALPEAAHILARSCGHWGSGAEYLFNTVRHLEESGIHDEQLWQLQELTAAEIVSLQAGPDNKTEHRLA